MASIETEVIIQASTVEQTNHLAHLLVDKIKAATPVRTGNLQAGWEYEPVSSVGEPVVIKNDVKYASFVNDGTRHMKGQHMLQRGINGMAGRVR